MAGLPPPTPELTELANLLGVENVRTLVKTFLGEYPMLLAQLTSGDRQTRHRIVHSLKSNARVIGAHELSTRMANYEARLGRAQEPDLTPTEVTAIRTDFDAFSVPLRRFATDSEGLGGRSGGQVSSNPA